MPDFYRSKVEILPGTPRQMGGPHPPTMHEDEIELMDEDTWEAAKRITKEVDDDAAKEG